MFRELMWLGAILAVVGVLIVGYLASLVVRRAVDRRKEKQIVGQADYSRRLNPRDGGMPRRPED
jgi:H+/gluconate symporter-like permease